MLMNHTLAVLLYAPMKKTGKNSYYWWLNVEFTYIISDIIFDGILEYVSFHNLSDLLIPYVDFLNFRITFRLLLYLLNDLVCFCLPLNCFGALE